MLAAGQFSAKRLLVACLLVTALGERAYAAPIAPTAAAITTVDSARHSSAGGTLVPHPAKLRGVVTAFAGWKNSFFLQDETGAIGVDRLEQTPVHVGDEVEVTGTIQPGLFAPLMLSNAVQVLGKGNLPAPRVSTYYELSRGNLDSRRVEVSGIVHSAAIGEIWGKQVLFLDLRTSDGGDITVHVIDFPDKGFDRLVDSTVRVWGACGAVPNDHRQIVGVRLFVPDLQDIAIESPAADSSRLPFSSIDSLAQFHPDASLEHRVRIKGTVTFEAPGSMLYLQSNGSGIRVETRQRGAFEPGVRVEAFGFVAADGYSPILEDAIVRRIGPGVAPMPMQLKAAQVITTEDRFTRTPYDGLLVHIEGKIIERLPGTEGELWLLQDKTVRFQAELSQFSQNLSGIEPGTLVGLSGICRAEADVRRNPTSFRILLRTEQDMTVLRTAYSTVSVVFLVSAAVFIVGIGLLVFWLQEGYLGLSLPARRNVASKP